MNGSPAFDMNPLLREPLKLEHLKAAEIGPLPAIGVLGTTLMMLFSTPRMGAKPRISALSAMPGRFLLQDIVYPEYIDLDPRRIVKGCGALALHLRLTSSR